MKTKKEATEVGHALAKKMGPGWKVRTWENLGWHVEVVFGIASVRPHRRDYTAEVQLDEVLQTHAPYGISIQFFGADPDPKKALAKAIEAASTGITGTRRAMDVLAEGLVKLL